MKIEFKTLKKQDFHYYNDETKHKLNFISDSVNILSILLTDDTFKDLQFFVNTGDYVMYNHLKGCFIVVNKLTLVSMIATAFTAIRINLNSAKVNNIVDQLLVSSHANITPINKYFKHRYIAFINGTFDINTLVLHNHNPIYPTLYYINEIYISNAVPVKFIKFLFEFSKGDVMVIAAVRSMLNIIIRSELKYQKFFVIMGPGGTGKSQLVNIIIHMMGQEATLSSTLELLCKNSFEMANLRNKKLLVLNDASNYRGEVSTIKRITGNDLLQARIKYVQEPFDFYNQSILLMSTNNPPFSYDHTGAMTRRMVLIPGINISVKKLKSTKIMEYNSDTESFEGEVVGEISSIINWSLGMDKDTAGYYLNNHYQPYIATKELPELEKNLGSFIELHLQSGEGEFLSDSRKKEGLFDRYLSYSAEKHPLGVKNFYKNLLLLLEEKGISCKSIKKNKGIYISGVSFVEEKKLLPESEYILPIKLLKEILKETSSTIESMIFQPLNIQIPEKTEILTSEEEKFITISDSYNKTIEPELIPEEIWVSELRSKFSGKLKSDIIFTIQKQPI